MKARNRIDGRIYAVKKVTLPDKPDERKKILREVNLLSALSHPYCVRFFFALFFPIIEIMTNICAFFIGTPNTGITMLGLSQKI